MDDVNSGSKGGIKNFDCYSDPTTLGTRWTRWLTSFEFFADGKGLITLIQERMQPQYFIKIL